MKILIIDDNKSLQESMIVLMEHWGFEFDIASNGREGVDMAIANDGEYDVCIMDVEMPVMSGCDAVKEIRRNVKYLPIIAYSGNPFYKDNCENCDFDEFLDKPGTPDELMEKIKKLTKSTG